MPERHFIDTLLEIVAFFSTVFLFAFPLYFFHWLPDEIPKHFSAEGTPDSFTSKYNILILPLIGLLLYVGLTLVNRVPHRFNYPVDITPENAPRQYQIATRAIRTIKTMVIVTFCYVMIEVVMTALCKSEGFKGYIVFILLVSMLIAVIILIRKAYNEPNKVSTDLSNI